LQTLKILLITEVFIKLCLKYVWIQLIRQAITLFEFHSLFL